MVLNLKNSLKNLFRNSNTEGQGLKSEKKERILKDAINSSFNSSSTAITVTNSTFTNMISTIHTSKTGNVLIIGVASVIVQTANGDVNMRLSKSGNEIVGSTNNIIWNTGDGSTPVSIMASTTSEIGKPRTFALQWAEGDAELDFAAGGSLGAYNIFVMDI